MTDAHGWQPISTAPRDGTRVLVWSAATGPYSTQWTDGQWPLFQWGRMTGNWYPWPTHWRALPAPPQENKP